MRLLIAILILSLIGCGENADTLRVTSGLNDGLNIEPPTPNPPGGGGTEPPPVVEPPPPPPPPPPGTTFIAMAWDGQNAQSSDWNIHTFNAIGDSGSNLLSKTPTDIAEFCPQFGNLNDEGKKMFWISLVAAVTKHESNFDPSSSQVVPGPLGNIIKRGLTRIDLDRAQVHKCNASQSTDLENSQINLECAIIMMDYWINTEDYISRAVANGGFQGAARVWPSLQGGNSLQDIKNITSSNEVCM